MNKKYIVRLSDAERRVCEEVVKKLKGTSQKVRRAQVLLKADADGAGWTDEKICEAYGCRVQTVENVRQRLVMDGFELPPGRSNGFANDWLRGMRRDRSHSSRGGRRAVSGGSVLRRT